MTPRRRGLVRLIALGLGVVMWLGGAAFAQAPPPPSGAPIQGLERLSPEERAVAERNLERWRGMTAEQRERALENYRHWKSLSP